MKYLLTVQVRFDAFDDFSAREKSSNIFELTKINETGELEEALGCELKIDSKLQEIKDKEVPRKVEI